MLAVGMQAWCSRLIWCVDSGLTARRDLANDRFHPVVCEVDRLLPSLADQEVPWPVSTDGGMVVVSGVVDHELLTRIATESAASALAEALFVASTVVRNCPGGLYAE